jgi:gliding motility-associated-like protein
MICVDPLPLAEFTASPMVTLSDNPSVQFYNESTLNEFNQWDFGDGFLSSVESPNHIFPIGIAGSYLVTLIVTTDAGCSDTTSQIIVVKDQLNVYVPNTFTPDGDEFNNVFEAVIVNGFDPTSFQMKIYDRGGELIFLSQDISIGWDGSYRGKYAKSDTYIWEITFKADENDKMYTYRGHVSLIR